MKKNENLEKFTECVYLHFCISNCSEDYIRNIEHYLDNDETVLAFFIYKKGSMSYPHLKCVCSDPIELFKRLSTNFNVFS